ncbi:MAG: amidase [Geminicoccaceae bacterium]
MAQSDEIAWKSVTDLASMIRRRQLSPVEVMDATIARIEKRNPSLNGFVYLAFDEARAGAKAAEKALMSGAALGPLHGVPSAIKDLFNFKPGWPATLGGIRALKDFRPPLCGVMTERMEAAGAVIVGKTNSPVMGFRGVTDNYLFGPTRNPFDTTRNSGGSSGGAAAVVADGLLSFAEASDGGGSIRIPAAFCGAVGFKPSYGRVPMVTRPNAFGGMSPFLAELAVTRSVEDTALVLQSVGGYDARDPFSLDEKMDYLSAVRRPLQGVRIAVSHNLDVYPVDPEVAATFAEAVKVFAEAGAVVEEVTIGIKRSQRELSDLWCRLVSPLNVAALETMKANGLDLMGKHAGDLPPEYRAWIEKAYKAGVVDLLADQAMRTEIVDLMVGLHERYDLLVSPTLACLPVKNAEDGNTLGPATVNGEEVDRLIGWCLTYLQNFTGQPAISVPAGLSASGLPVGLQITGRRYADLDVLAAAATFERLRPWAQHYQRCEQRPL